MLTQRGLKNPLLIYRCPFLYISLANVWLGRKTFMLMVMMKMMMMIIIIIIIIII